MKKTNAMRILEQLDIPFESRDYETGDQLIDGIHVAEKVKMRYDTVFKTLVCHEGRDLFVFVIPVDGKLDLKKAAAAAGRKRLEMLMQKDLKPNTGYVHGGCSPIGLKKPCPIFIDQSAADKEKIAVSAGRIGTQLLLKPDDLKRAVNASYEDLTAG